jgi:hypothetical protein
MVEKAFPKFLFIVIQRMPDMRTQGSTGLYGRSSKKKHHTNDDSFHGSFVVGKLVVIQVGRRNYKTSTNYQSCLLDCNLIEKI